MPTRTYNLHFWLLCLSSTLFMSSFNMIIPELPGYITLLGGEDYKGLIIPLFTITAGFSKPFSGKLADSIGRIPVMVIGSIVCLVCGFLYPLFSTLTGFLFLRFMHGFSTGFKPTGTTAYLSDLVPITKRGEALGILGICGGVGMALGPAIGSYIAMEYSLETMFYCSSAFALLSLLTIAWMKESVKDPQEFRLNLLKVSRKDFFESRVLSPSIVMLLTVFSFGIILTIIPDYSEYLGLENKGIFFTVFVIASITVRLVAGKASDRYGRVLVLKIGAVVQFIAMTYIGLAGSPTELLIGAFLLGIGAGTTSPTVFAWTIDLSSEQYRARAMSTMFIAMEMGIGLGGFISGWTYSNDPEMFCYTFWSGALLAFFALIYLQFHKASEALQR